MSTLALAAEPILTAWDSLPDWARYVAAGAGGFVVAYAKLAWDIAFIKGEVKQINADRHTVARLKTDHALLTREVKALKESIHGTELVPAAATSHAPSGFPRHRR